MKPSTNTVSFLKAIQPALLLAVLSIGTIGASQVVNAAESPTSVAAAEQIQAMVNINSADAQTLSDKLKGIGLKKAQAIIEWRSANGNFTHIDQLLEVKGIGEKVLEVNRSLIQL